mmetsp:Transcript_9208/g.24962  ORF Transcript_9208/g.24962 Transcript_9208/m.24962 type:complete len:265 (+) Transcript_9208:244-1038(+)
MVEHCFFIPQQPFYLHVKFFVFCVPIAHLFQIPIHTNEDLVTQLLFAVEPQRFNAQGQRISLGYSRGNRQEGKSIRPFLCLSFLCSRCKCPRSSTRFYFGFYFFFYFFFFLLCAFLLFFLLIFSIHVQCIEQIPVDFILHFLSKRRIFFCSSLSPIDLCFLLRYLFRQAVFVFNLVLVHFILLNIIFNFTISTLNIYLELDTMTPLFASIPPLLPLFFPIFSFFCHPCFPCLVLFSQSRAHLLFIIADFSSHLCLFFFLTDSSS